MRWIAALFSNSVLCILPPYQNATSALANAEASASNVQTLTTNVGELSANTNEANETVTALEERADRDSEAITEANVVAGYAESNLTVTEARIVAVKAKLDGISQELNSLKLIPQDKFDDLTMRLESINGIFDTTYAALEKARLDLAQAEDQFANVQEKYATLLQHRDLLKDILENVEQLDCVKMTSPS